MNAMKRANHQIFYKLSEITTKTRTNPRLERRGTKKVRGKKAKYCQKTLFLTRERLRPGKSRIKTAKRARLRVESRSAKPHPVAQ